MFGFGNKSVRPMVRAVSASEVGLVRSNNEDHLLVDGAHLVYGVADGMGGGAEGEKASELVCAEVSMLVRQQPEDFSARMEAVCNAVISANEAIYDYAKLMGFQQMGTTLSLMMFDPEDASHAVICHIGDSRVYRYRKGEIAMLTRDHSVGAELERRYGAGEGFADRANPLSHILTRAIGTGESVCPEWKKLTVESGDRYLVCTDGVHDVVSNDRMRDLLGQTTLDDALASLTDEVYSCGAPDNFSVVIFDVEGQCS